MVKSFDKSINCLIFSKDRPAQLDLLLLSIDRHAPVIRSAQIEVLATADHFAQGYQLCSRRWAGRNFAFCPQSDFDGTIRRWLECYGQERMVMFSDDDIIYRPLPSPLIQSHNLALRLGHNTRHCMPLGIDQPLPPMRLKEEWFSWNWREGQGDFGYPLAIGGHVYYAHELLPLLDGWYFGDPTQLEAGLMSNVDAWSHKRMVAPVESCVVSIPANRVTTSSHNPIGDDPAETTEALNERFLEGWRLDLDAMDFSNITDAHQLIPYTWRKT